jgi:nitroreductase
VDIYEAIEKRRTIRRFKAPATAEQLRRIITAGSKAPSRRNTQFWEVVIVDDPALIEKIGERKYVLNRGNKPREEKVSPELEAYAQRQKDSFANASLILVYYGIVQTSWAVAFDAASAWLFIENICLAAVAEGLGTRIATFWEGAEKDISQIVQVPEGMALAAAISIGVPAEEPGPRTLKPQEKWLHRNRY